MSRSRYYSGRRSSPFLIAPPALSADELVDEQLAEWDHIRPSGRMRHVRRYHALNPRYPVHLLRRTGATRTLIRGARTRKRMIQKEDAAETFKVFGKKPTFEFVDHHGNVRTRRSTAWTFGEGLAAWARALGDGRVCPPPNPPTDW